MPKKETSTTDKRSQKIRSPKKKEQLYASCLPEYKNPDPDLLRKENRRPEEEAFLNKMFSTTAGKTKKEG